MSEHVNVHAAKTHLSALLERVEQGEEIIIARSGHPVARLVPLRAKQRVPGRFKGGVDIPTEAFFEPLPESELAGWEGRETSTGTGG